MKHQFTEEERRRGGKKTTSNKEHQSHAWRCLEEKNPFVARAIIKRHYGHVGWPGRKENEQS